MDRAQAPFLTALDPRSAIRGSRDPLGLQPVWTSLGRELVGNLTTVTTSYRNFTSLLLAQFLADEAIARGLGGEADRCDLFLRAEQLVGYSRVAGKEESEASAGRILGITRIKKNLSTPSARPRLSTSGEWQLLGDQKTYGLWGLYSVASRQSGLSELEVNKPSALGRKLIEDHYLPGLVPACGRDAKRLLDLLKEGATFEPRAGHAAIARSVAAIHVRKPGAAERRVYDEAIVRGIAKDVTSGRQARLWAHLADVNDRGEFRWRDEFGFAELVEVARRARTTGDDGVADRLDRIAVIEPVLVAASLVFGLMLDRDDQALSAVAGEVRKTWARGLAHLRGDAVEALRPRLAEAVGDAAGGRLVQLARSLAAGHFEQAMRACLDQNADVMRARGGSAWVEVRSGKLHVVMRQDTTELPPARDLPRIWMNPYFINSLKAVGAQVNGKAS